MNLNLSIRRYLVSISGGVGSLAWYDAAKATLPSPQWYPILDDLARAVQMHSTQEELSNDISMIRIEYICKLMDDIEKLPDWLRDEVKVLIQVPRPVTYSAPTITASRKRRYGASIISAINFMFAAIYINLSHKPTDTYIDDVTLALHVIHSLEKKT